MKKTKLVMLLTLPLLLTGCVETIPTKGDVVADIPSFLSEESKAYHITFGYDDQYFANSFAYSHDLQMLSYGASMATTTPSSVKNFYMALSFDNITTHLPTPTEDTIGYAFAHKAMSDANLVAVSIRGLDYGMEWINNFTLGKEGNHQGFELRANEIYEELVPYMYQYRAKPVKLWLTGYSRAGGVANVLASKIMQNHSALNIKPQNFFTYTFEAPTGLTIENAVKYDNVYNIVNATDLVAMIPPEEYGLYRCGKDIIYSDLSEVDAKLAALDPSLSLPTFTSDLVQGVTNEVEFANHVISYLMEDTFDENTNLSTREDFVKNYQDHICFFMKLYFTAPEGTIPLLIERLKEKSMWEILSLLSVEDGVYNFVKPILDEKEVVYEDDALHQGCAALTNLIGSKIVLVGFAFASEEYMNNLKRCVDMHAMEMVYVIMK